MTLAPNDLTYSRCLCNLGLGAWWHSTNFSTYTKLFPPSFTTVNTLNAPRPSLPWDSSTLHFYFATPPLHNVHNNGVSDFSTSTYSHTPITTTVFFLPTLFMSNSTSTPPHHTAATTRMGICISALLALASHTENTTVGLNLNSCRTTFPFQRNCPSVTGIPTTIFTPSHPFNFLLTTPTTKLGSRNTTSSPTGCRRSIGLSFHITSSSKKAGNSQSTAPISTLAWPPTSDYSANFADGNMPFMNPIFSLPLDYTPSHSFAISPSTHWHPLKQPSNYAAANIQTWKFTPSDEWPPTWKNLAAAKHYTSSTKRSSNATSVHPSPTSHSPYRFWLMTSFPNTANNGSKQQYSTTNTWPSRSTYLPTVCGKQPTRLSEPICTTTAPGRIRCQTLRPPVTCPVHATT